VLVGDLLVQDHGAGTGSVPSGLPPVSGCAATFDKSHGQLLSGLTAGFGR
jgi:hypothetical protein